MESGWRDAAEADGGGEFIDTEEGAVVEEEEEAVGSSREGERAEMRRARGTSSINRRSRAVALRKEA